jgi:hypothetical protein
MKQRQFSVAESQGQNFAIGSPGQPCYFAGLFICRFVVIVARRRCNVESDQVELLPGKTMNQQAVVFSYEGH